MVTIQPNTTTGYYEAGTGEKEMLFRCPIKWVVRGATSGFVVQHIQRNEKYKASTLAGEDIDVVSRADYWEAWEIDSQGVANPIGKDGYNDNFGVYRDNRAIFKGNKVVSFPTKKGTKGRWKIRGTVYYVPAANFDLTHWYRDRDPVRGFIGEPGSVPAAGMLLSRWDAPAAGNGLVTGALGRAMCIRQFAGSWDWTKTPPVSARRAWPLGGNFDSAITGGV